MSLINKMLRDLDKRGAGELSSPDLQREVRPLPERRRRRSPLWSVGALAGVAGAAWFSGALDPYVVPMLAPALVLPAPAARLSAAPAPAPAASPPAQGAALAAPSAQAPAQAPVTLPRPTVPALQQPVSTPPSPTEPTRSTVRAPSAVSASANAALARIEPRSPAASGLPEAAALRSPAAAPGSVPGVEKKPAVQTPRERAEADFRRAQAHIAQGRSQEAIEALQAALAQDAAYGAPRQALVKLLLEQKRQDEAMFLLKEGLETQPAQIGWALSLARLQVDRADYAAAEKTLGRSWKHAASNASYAGFYGHVQHRLGHGPEALELYQAAIRLTPGDGRWWLGLAAVLEAGGRSLEAKEAYQRALDTGSLGPDLAALAERKAR